MKPTIFGSLLLAFSLIGCGQSGFIALAEPASAASPSQYIPIHASRDIGRPYRVLGFVFRTTEGHKSGLERIDSGYQKRADEPSAVAQDQAVSFFPYRDLKGIASRKPEGGTHDRSAIGCLAKAETAPQCLKIRLDQIGCVGEHVTCPPLSSAGPALYAL